MKISIVLIPGKMKAIGIFILISLFICFASILAEDFLEKYLPVSYITAGSLAMSAGLLLYAQLAKNYTIIGSFEIADQNSFKIDIEGKITAFNQDQILRLSIHDYKYKPYNYLTKSFFAHADGLHNYIEVETSAEKMTFQLFIADKYTFQKLVQLENNLNSSI